MRAQLGDARSFSLERQLHLGAFAVLFRPQALEQENQQRVRVLANHLPPSGRSTSSGCLKAVTRANDFHLRSARTLREHVEACRGA